MRVPYFIIVLFVLTTRIFAQGAADKDAVDLSGKMDTIARSDDEKQSFVFGSLAVQLQNDDEWEDIEIAYSDGAKLRLGGPLLFDTLNNPRITSLITLDGYADFDGDGIGDLVNGGAWWHKGKKEFPYFDDTINATFYIQGHPTRHTFGIIDYDLDGYQDVFIRFDEIIKRYAGSPNFNKGGRIIADDSMVVRVDGKAEAGILTVGKFGKNLPPMAIVAVEYDSASVSIGKIGVIKNSVRLSDDSIVWLSSTNDGSGGRSAFNLYATDITGDGVTDLIISDRYHLYIYKGGDDFGTYPLTPQNAFYTIRSPRLMDFSNFGFMDDFGEFMYACGDISGSGIPYLMVGGDQAGSGYHKSYAFFYAGGKALDTLYDGIVGIVNGSGFTMDTLHSINSTGRSACLLMDYIDEDHGLDNLGLLAFRDCDKLPHKTNPAMLTSVRQNIDNEETLRANCFPLLAKKFVKVKIRSPKFTHATLMTYSILGEKITQREVMLDAGDNVEFFDTSTLPEGTYVVQIISDYGITTTKFLKQR